MKTPANPQPGKRHHKKRATPAQLRSRSAIRRTSRAWAYLTEEQRLTWTGGGKDERSRSRGGRRPRLSGQKYFMKINTPRAFHDLPLLTVKPGDAKPSPAPVVRLNITPGARRFRLKLTLSAAPAELTELQASPPQSPGRSFCNDFRSLGPLPATKGSELDITDPYLKKFRNLPPGSKVFARVRQLIGSRYEPGVHACALAQAPGAAFRAPTWTPETPGVYRKCIGGVSEVYR